MRTAALRWLRRGLLGVGALVFLILAAAGLAVWWTLPAERGTLRIPSLAAPVAIDVDAAGVPTIRAASERDAWTSVGWLHARDRLFQMEMMRRGAAGRLSEIAGPATLRSDRFVRLLGLARRAEADLAALPAEVRDVLDAYAAGVNAWIAAHGRFAAPEFLLLGAPEPWRPSDSLLWAKFMGLWLSGNWRVELDRVRLLAAGLPADRLWDLWPDDETPGRPDLATVEAAVNGLDAGGHFARLAAAVPRFPIDAPLPASASNAWAVAPRHSASGGALLANDPHLGYGAPIQWYLLRIALPGGRFLAGATSPGVPLVVIGRNERLAWGFTTTHSDTQDVFVERLAGVDAYATPDGPRPFALREERIAVRGGDEIVLRVRETRHGPVVSDLDAPQGRPDGTVLAVAVANLAPDDTAAAGLLALNRARGVADARAAAALITAPPQNLMIADAEGRIALFLTGRTPVRRDGSDGTLPRPGWDGAADWTGWIPFDAMPHIIDPPGGVLANANNRVVPPGSEVFLGRDWPADWRFRRIGQLLAARERHDARGFAAMQGDVVSLFARETLPALLRLTRRPAGRAAGEALDLLAAWDGTVSADRPEPLVFHAWMRAFGRAALAAGGVPEGAWDASSRFLGLVLRDPEGRGAPWCGQAGCAALLGASLEEAIAGLQARFGPESSAWRWGEAHVARFEHPLLRAVPLLGALTRLSVPTPGDEATVNRGGFRDVGATPFANVHGAGLRAVFDLAEPRAGLAVIATGQSGHPLSRHWGDLLPRWRDGAMLSLGFGPTGDAAAEAAIRLLP
jgi:penicillin amidase